MAMVLEGLIRKAMRKQGYKPGEAKGITKSQVLEEMDAQTITLIAAIPPKTMESIWRALGVEDG